MRTIVDRTTDALNVEVCSVYLMERDGARLRLAATNGLDRDQVGRVTMALGEGLTGRAAQLGQPVASPDVRVDPRFKWVPDFDQSQFTSMLSVPMPWNDTIVGVVNVQAIETRTFSTEEVEFLVTIGALLGGVVEKGRLQAEAEEQLETLTALDGARAELLAVVTHELRTPLAVVRAYLDLLADAAVDAVGEAATPDSSSSEADESHASRGPRPGCRRRRGLASSGDRPGDAAGSARRLDPGVRSRRRPRRRTGPPALRHRQGRQRHDRRDGAAAAQPRSPPERHLGDDDGDRRRRPFPPGAGASPGERGQVLAGGRLGQAWARGPKMARSRSTSQTMGLASPRRNGNRSSKPTFAPPTDPAAPESGCTPPDGSWERWAGACGWSRMGTAAAGSWWPCPDAPN